MIRIILCSILNADYGDPIGDTGLDHKQNGSKQVRFDNLEMPPYLLPNKMSMNTVDTIKLLKLVLLAEH